MSFSSCFRNSNNMWMPCKTAELRWNHMILPTVSSPGEALSNFDIDFQLLSPQLLTFFTTFSTVVPSLQHQLLHFWPQSTDLENIISHKTGLQTFSDSSTHITSVFWAKCCFQSAFILVGQTAMLKLKHKYLTNFSWDYCFSSQSYLTLDSHYSK